VAKHRYRQERQRSAEPPAGRRGERGAQRARPSLEQAQLLRRRQGSGVPGPACPMRRRVAGSDAGVGGATGTGTSSGWGAASACSRWRMRVVMASSTVAVRRGPCAPDGVRGMGACRAFRRATSVPTERQRRLGPSCVVWDNAASS